MTNARAQAFRDLAISRHSTRSFQATPVPQEIISHILETAKHSPYVSGRKNWDVLVIDNPMLIYEVSCSVQTHCNDLRSKMQESFQDSFANYALNFVAFSQAPVLLIPVFRVTPSLTGMLVQADPVIASYERDNHVKSIGCVSMMLLLAAESHGLGACLMTGPLLAHASLLKILPIPNGREIGAIIPIGYPLEH